MMDRSGNAIDLTSTDDSVDYLRHRANAQHIPGVGVTGLPNNNFQPYHSHHQSWNSEQAGEPTRPSNPSHYLNVAGFPHSHHHHHHHHHHHQQQQQQQHYHSRSLPPPSRYPQKRGLDLSAGGGGSGSGGVEFRSASAQTPAARFDPVTGGLLPSPPPPNKVIPPLQIPTGPPVLSASIFASRRFVKQNDHRSTNTPRNLKEPSAAFNAPVAIPMPPYKGVLASPKNVPSKNRDLRNVPRSNETVKVPSNVRSSTPGTVDLTTSSPSPPQEHLKSNGISHSSLPPPRNLGHISGGTANVKTIVTPQRTLRQSINSKSLSNERPEQSPSTHSNSKQRSSRVDKPRAVPIPKPDLSKTAFRAIVKDTIREIRSQHDYTVKLQLQRARKLHEDHISAKNLHGYHAGNTLNEKRVRTKQQTSPFSDLETITPSGPATISPRNTIRLGQRFLKHGKDVSFVGSYSYVSYRDTSLAVPPYSNYISTRHNILVEDDKHRTSIPYLGDDINIDDDYRRVEEKLTRNAEYYEKLNNFTEQAYKFLPYIDDLLEKLGTNVENVLDYLINNREHSKAVEVLKNLSYSHVDHLEYGYYSQSDDSDTLKRRKKSKPKRAQTQWLKAQEHLGTSFTQDKIDRAALACSIFFECTGFSIWHVIKPSAEVIAEHGSLDRHTNKVKARKSNSPETYSLGTYATLGCLICKGHECPGHGEFEDKDDDKNLRHRVNQSEYRRANPEYDEQNQLTTALTIHDAFGLDDDGALSGAVWGKIVDRDDDDLFKDDELCSDNCFWSKANRIKLERTRQTAWSAVETKTLTALWPAYDDYRRAPCMLFQSQLSTKSCFEIFRYMFDHKISDNRTSFRTQNTLSTAPRRPNHRRPLDHWLDFDNAWKHHEREPFIPCNHPGPCDERSDCDCWRLEITCEKSCACADSCKRKFKGCQCAARNKACYNNEHCECNRLNRECDPDLCRSCGAHEVLDPVNRHEPDVLPGHCANVYIQRGVPKRTLLGHSKMMADGGRAGWGLYMGEQCRKDEYIGEYVGEIVTTNEAEQRGIIYDKRNMSYLFDVNKLQTLDSTLVGNKLRFINHQPNPMANVKPRTMFCNTVQRMGMYATRDINIGEELFFDYGADFSSKVSLIVQGKEGNITTTGGQIGGERVKPSTAGLPIRYGKGSTKPINLSKNGRRVGRPPKYNWVDPKTGKSTSNAFAHLNAANGSTKSNNRKRRHSLMIDGADDDDSLASTKSSSRASSESPAVAEQVVQDSEDERSVKETPSVIMLSDTDILLADSEDSPDEDNESEFGSDDAVQRRKRRKKTRKRRSDFGIKKGPRKKS